MSETCAALSPLLTHMQQPAAVWETGAMQSAPKALSSPFFNGGGRGDLTENGNSRPTVLEPAGPGGQTICVLCLGFSALNSAALGDNFNGPCVYGTHSLQLQLPLSMGGWWGGQCLLGVYSEVGMYVQ